MINGSSQSLSIAVLQSQLNEIIEELKRDVEPKFGYVDFQFYADTFVIHTPSAKIDDYPLFLNVSKNFIKNCIYKKLPIRGAISHGEVVFGHNRKIIIGSAFLESHEFCEDQDWLGLIITPSAAKELISNGLEPLRHGFINKDIPMRKLSKDSNNIYAYKFINGSTNFKSPLLKYLIEMQKQAPAECRNKYQNTIDFIEKYYPVHSADKN